MVVRQLLELLKAIAGNDEVKIAIVKAGGIRTILGAMSRYVQAPQVREKESRSATWGLFTPAEIARARPRYLCGVGGTTSFWSAQQRATANQNGVPLEHLLGVVHER